MKALILNSGLGSRMGVLTSEHPKCMTEISSRETILSRQLNMLVSAGIKDVVITTGYYDSALIAYCNSLDLPLNIVFVKNPDYATTNYIYSIYCAREYLDDDIILMHGDMVFENEVLDRILSSESSCMIVSSTADIPKKDFKAKVVDGKVLKVSVDIFNDVVSAQAVYKLMAVDFRVWLNKIVEFCENGNTNVYAENALNEISNEINIQALDIGSLLCAEIDDANDLAIVSSKLREVESRLVYMCFSTDIIHSGHISIIKKAQKLGRLIIGVLSDESIMTYKRFPCVPFEERIELFENIAGVYKVVKQDTLSYKNNLEKYKPNIVVHGDDWRNGIQKPIRDEVVSILASYGGKLVEYEYNADDKYKDIERNMRSQMSMPDYRRGRLRRVLNVKNFVSVMEVHDGLTGLLVENTVVQKSGGAKQFDAMWISSLCDSTAKGKPDIELVDMTSRLRTIEDVSEVTTKPIIFDGDTGGRVEHFVYNVRTLERLGVSMVIIEDKIGLKRNSLFGTDVEQQQDQVESFCDKIRAGKQAQRTKEFMICARIESLILEKGLEDALVRAAAYVSAGADAIMIHSRQKTPDEIIQFVNQFRLIDSVTPIVVVPTSFNTVTESEWKNIGVNIVIYANQLMRAQIPAMKKTMISILESERSAECDSDIMPFSDIIRLISSDV